MAQGDSLFHAQLMQAPQVLAEDALVVEGLEPEGQAHQLLEYHFLEPFIGGGLDGALSGWTNWWISWRICHGSKEGLASDAEPSAFAAAGTEAFGSSLHSGRFAAALPQPLVRTPQDDPLAATTESKEADDPAAWVLLVLASPDLGNGV